MQEFRFDAFIFGSRRKPNEHTRRPDEEHVETKEYAITDAKHEERRHAR